MDRIRNTGKRIKYSFMCLAVICFILPVYGASVFGKDDPAQGEKILKQIEVEKSKNKKIKRKQRRDYKKGVLKSDKKDHVKNWIKEEKDYHKKAVNLAEDYVEWAKDQKPEGKKISFKKYLSEKKLTRQEKKILYSYLKGQKKRRPHNRVRKRRAAKISLHEPKNVVHEGELSKDKKIEENMDDKGKGIERSDLVLIIIAGLSLVGGGFLVVRKFLLRI